MKFLLALWASLLLGCSPKPVCSDCPLAPELPIQHNLPVAAALSHGELQLIQRATYSVTAVILSIKRYDTWFPGLDLMDGAAPLDLALAWGPVASRPDIQDQLKVSQRHRFFFWRAGKGNLLPIRQALLTGMANTHIVPANEKVAEQIDGLEVGQVVLLSGSLVDISRNGRVMRTSMTRDDYGAGACEILYVDHVEVKGRQ